MKIPLRILMIEDSKTDAALILHNLKKSDYDITSERVETAEQLTEALENRSWDIIFADYRLPSFDGATALKLFNKTGLDIPFIIISGAIGEELAISLMKSGAHDYLMKENLARLLAVVQRELQEAQGRRDYKKAEKALRENEEMYRNLLNASPEGIVILEKCGKINDISDIALLILGCDDKKDLIGKPFSQFTSNGEKKKIHGLLKKTAEEKLAQNVEIRLTRRDQTQFNGEISITMIPDIDGNPRTYMAIIRDNSQRKNVEQQLIHTERMASLGEMATGIAHEINQPLNIITISLENLFYEFLTKKTIDEKYIKDKSDKIFENVTRIKNIIDHIRSFSRYHDEYILTSFDIRDSIRNAISMISEQFRHRDIELILNFDLTIDPIIGNTYKFEQVILNLLINAKDAIEEKRMTQPSGLKNFIRITTRRDDKNIIVEVSDNGIGIKPEEMNKIMLPFYSTKDVGKGTGLGLSISFGIIKEMNGNIDVTSEVNVGTTLQITLPLHQETFVKSINHKILSN